MPKFAAPVALRTIRSTRFRAAQLVAGLALWGLASALLIRSQLGLGPWDAFHVGLHHVTGLSIGRATIITGFAVLLSTMLMGVRPGVATVANMVLLGVFVDLILPVVPVAPHPVAAFLYFAAGLGLAGLATGLYIGAGFGQGPRDALMVAIQQRSGWSIRRARALLEAAALAAGWAMGGTVGIGTVLFALGIGPVVQWGLRTFPPPEPPADDDVSRDVAGLRRAA